MIAWPSKLKIAIWAGWTVFVIGATLHVHNKFLDAAKLEQTEKRLDKAQAAPAKIIYINQEMRKTNVDGDKCGSSPIPEKALELLRK